jgi:hypothetical protein
VAEIMSAITAVALILMLLLRFSEPYARRRLRRAAMWNHR